MKKQILESLVTYFGQQGFIYDGNMRTILFNGTKIKLNDLVEEIYTDLLNLKLRHLNENANRD